MGRPSPTAPSATTQLATQHERLILELLPFKEVGQFHEWLQSGFVRGSWLEFSRDFLSRNPRAPEPDKARTAQAAKDAINGRSVKYLVYHPDKAAWTPEDHHVRFIATVVADNMLKDLWGKRDWEKRGLDIAKAVYEVLSFLRSTVGAEQQQQLVSQDPPGYLD